MAAIDIGSNAARLLIKEIEINTDTSARLRKCLFLRIPLRLGMEVFKNGKITDEKAYQFLHTMKAYKQLMKVYHVKKYRACATSAMRDASNGKDVLKDIEKETGLKIEIISGEEESQIVYDNHLSLLSGEGNFLYVDVGGGSTEITFLSNSKRIRSHSYNIGTIRLLNGKVSKEDFQKMKDELKTLTKDYDNITIIGSGGNINKLYRISGKNGKQSGSFSVETLRRLYNQLKDLSVEERINSYGLKPDRADVIVPAAEIFLQIADSINSKTIMVPNLGLADGIINELLKDYLQKAEEDDD